jgi:hypothetical protein
MLRTSAHDFARFLTIFTNEGTSEGVQILSRATLKLFFADQGVSVAGNAPRRQALI